MNDDLVALLNVYNEADLLPGCIASLAGQVDRVILADGRYQHYPGEGDGSSDGTLDVARNAAGEADLRLDVIAAPAGAWPTEHGKRTALVTHPSLQLGEMCLVIDADERLVCNRRGALRQFYGDYKLDVNGKEGTPGNMQAVRLFMWRPGMEYRWHFNLQTPSGRRILAQHRVMPHNIAHLEHYHATRSPERIADDKEWEAWLVPYEKSIGAYGRRQ